MPLFIRNIPFFSIMLAMMAGIISIPVRKGKAAWYIAVVTETIVLAMSTALLVYIAGSGETITFMMGHFPAPWGNEIRAGIIEAMMATVFSAIMLFSVMGGRDDALADILPEKQNLYFITYDELFGALLALVYTNDLFTAYVFIEISMLAASSLIMAKDSGRSLIATLRYLVMMLLGSGLFLLGLIILYTITGHLLMPDIGEGIRHIVQENTYTRALLCVIGLMCLGLSVKSAVFPFHTMLPGAHSVATTTSSAVLSGLVLKGYIFLLIKCITRVFSVELMVNSNFTDVALVLGIAGTVICSLFALRESDIKRMIAYSSSAQIGYIYMGIGLAATGGLVAAIMHIIVHALTKSLMFICAGNLASACGHQTDARKMRGAAALNRPAAIGFTLAALSMIGIPLFPGFASKLYIAQAAYHNTALFVVVLITLLISMVLNALYFVPAVIAIWSKPQDAVAHKGYKPSKLMAACVVAAVVALFALGLFFGPVAELIQRGLETL